MMILSLGGNVNRISTTIKQSNNLTSLGIKHFIVLSGFGEQVKSVQKIKDRLSDKSVEVIIDGSALDTLGNFTTTYKYVKQRKVEGIFVVTDDWHLPRSMAIANTIYVGTNVGLRGVPHIESKRKDPGNLYVDVIRALAWRLFKE